MAPLDGWGSVSVALVRMVTVESPSTLYIQETAKLNVGKAAEFPVKTIQEGANG